MNLLELNNVSFRYPDGTQALKGISTAIAPGEKIVVLGPNGAGKSTFFLCLNGILRPQEGDLFYNGKKLTYKKSELNALRKEVGIVFQDPDMQLFSSSVIQEIAFGPLNLRLPQEEVRSRVESVIEELNLNELKEKPTHFLSYGQKKRVSIADILVMEPSIIIFDEPTACLDPLHTRILHDIFHHLSQHGITVMISTHDVTTAWEFADRILVLDHGKIRADGPPSTIFEDTALLQETSLEQPPLLQFYHLLLDQSVLSSSAPPPRTLVELKKLFTEQKNI